jgi:hypothetical protein
MEYIQPPDQVYSAMTRIARDYERYNKKRAVAARIISRYKQGYGELCEENMEKTAYIESLEATVRQLNGVNRALRGKLELKYHEKG